MLLVNSAVLSSIAATALFIYLYPKNALWSLEHVRITGLRPHLWNGQLTVYAVAKVMILNTNYLGSNLIKSRFDIYVQRPMNLSTRNHPPGTIFAPDNPKGDGATTSFLPRVGFIEVGQSAIYGSANGPTDIKVDITIDRLDMSQIYHLLQLLWWSNGSLDVIALGAALVQADVVNEYLDPLMIVFMRCPEQMYLHFSLYSVASLAQSPSQNCQFTYNWSPHAFNNETELPPLSSRYLFEAL